MTNEVQNLLVRRSITIAAPPQHVFDVFVNRLDLWWPRTHHIGKTSAFQAKLEPKLGGRWYEVGDDGTECDWGQVLVWEPPRRLVLTWDINAQWQHDPSIANEVEVLFQQQGTATRVELEHRKIERYGDQAQAMHAVFSSDSGWSGILQRLLESAVNTPR
jgi:uncharacterized protein YndB with AHSA1/START domain